MQYKSYIIAMAFTLFSLSASSQVRKHLDQLAKDPKTKENAAKADVYIVKNDSIFNPSTFEPNKTVSKELPPPKKKKEISPKN